MPAAVNPKQVMGLTHNKHKNQEIRLQTISRQFLHQNAAITSRNWTNHEFQLSRQLGRFLEAPTLCEFAALQVV